MNTIPAQEIKRRGIAAVDALLEDGPVHVIRNNRPRYVVMSEEQYVRLIKRQGLWELVDRPTRGTRTRAEIDAQLRGERESWDSVR